MAGVIRHDGDDRPQCRMGALESGPLRIPTEAAAVYADLAVAPGLLADPTTTDTDAPSGVLIRRSSWMVSSTWAGAVTTTAEQASKAENARIMRVWLSIRCSGAECVAKESTAIHIDGQDVTISWSRASLAMIVATRASSELLCWARLRFATRRYTDRSV
jgi:hypothetical protein